MVKRLLYSGISKLSILSLACVLVSFCFSASAFASTRRVTGVTYAGQSGTATAGTGTSVTYVISLSEAGSNYVNSDNIALTWAAGSAPTGVTWNFTSGSETISNGNTASPTF